MTDPTVIQNPNPSVPLAALVMFEADKPVSTTLTVSDGDRSWELEFDESHDPSEGLPVLGMRADLLHEIQVTIRDIDNGTEVTYPEALEFTTPALPTDPTVFPPIEAKVSNPEKMEPGVSLLSVRRLVPGQPEVNKSLGLIIGLDEAGEVIWYYQTDARVSDVERLKSGNIIYLTHDFRAVEIDMLGNVVTSWYASGRPQGALDDGSIPVDAMTFHHEIDELPSGNLLIMSTDSQLVEDYPNIALEPSDETVTTDVMGDEIIEIERDGTVVWRWNTFDWLDEYRVGYDLNPTYWIDSGFPDTLDWTHGNGMFYDENDDSLLISLRMQDAVVKVDRATGEIVWTLGEPSDWPIEMQDGLFSLKDTERWFWHQHFPILTPEGNVMLFDNGIFQARPPNLPVPFAQSMSRAVEYKLDLGAMTAQEVWTSDIPGPDALLCASMGQVDWLPEKGNALVAYGACRAMGEGGLPWSRVREYSRDGASEVVWEVAIRDQSENPTGWIIYGSERQGPLQ